MHKSALAAVPEAPALMRESLPGESLLEQITVAHEMAQAAHKSAVGHAIRAGQLLLAAKTRVPHGEWLAWVDRNCKFTSRTATGYMRLALLPRAKQQRVADLSLRQSLDVLAEPRKKTLFPPKPRATELRKNALTAPKPEIPVGEAERAAEPHVEEPIPEGLQALLLAWRDAPQSTRKDFVAIWHNEIHDLLNQLATQG